MTYLNRNLIIMKPVKVVCRDEKHAFRRCCHKEETIEAKPSRLNFKKLSMHIAQQNNSNSMNSEDLGINSERTNLNSLDSSLVQNGSPSPLRRLRRIRKAKNNKKEDFRFLNRKSKPQSIEGPGLSIPANTRNEQPLPTSFSIQISISIFSGDDDDIVSPSPVSLENIDADQGFESSHLNILTDNQISNGNSQQTPPYDTTGIATSISLRISGDLGHKEQGLDSQEIQTVLASEKRCETSEEDSCVICISNFERNETMIQLPCNHNFHTNCITGWLKNKRKCPICRKDASNR